MTTSGVLFGRRLAPFSNATWPYFRAPLTLLIPVEQEWRERLPSMREQAQTLHQNPDMFDDEITPGPRSSPVFEGLYPTPVDALARRVTQRAQPNSAA